MQKKIAFFIPVLLVAGLSVNAQFKKGMRMAGTNVGSIFFNSGSADVTYPSPTTGYTSKTTGFGVNIAPTMGWFISDHTAVGLSLNINPTSNKTTYEIGGKTYQKDKVNGFNFGIGGFARNYFKSSSSFMPFGQLGLNLGISSQKTEGFFYGGSGASAYKLTYDGKSSGGFFANAALSFGMTKMVTPHTGLDISIGYSYSYNKNTYKTTTLRDDGNNGTIDLTSESNPTSKYTNHGLVLGVGFQIFLDARK
jgi:outer membrane protein W